MPIKKRELDNSIEAMRSDLASFEAALGADHDAVKSLRDRIDSLETAAFSPSQQITAELLADPDSLAMLTELVNGAAERIGIEPARARKGGVTPVLLTLRFQRWANRCELRQVSSAEVTSDGDADADAEDE